jgi:uncharacterized membrane protein
LEDKAMQTNASQISSAAQFDGLFESAARWLYRATFVIAPACYIARLMKTPMAIYLMEATVALVVLLLVHSLVGFLLKRAHLVSEAAFNRPASWSAGAELQREPAMIAVRTVEAH